MTKKLTERAAWLAIATAFYHDSAHAAPSLLSRYGFCYAIGQLFDTGRISEAIWWRMKRRINSIRTAYGTCHPHKWPIDTDGRVSRARAARRFAKQLTRKPTSK